MSCSFDAEDTRPHYVYRCYDAGDQLLYIGCAYDVEARIYHHLKLCNIGKQPNGGLYLHYDHHAAKRYPTKVAARAAERAAITDEAPLLNRQHNPKRFHKVGAATYGFVGEVHPISAEAFAPERVVTADEVRAALRASA